MPQYRVLRVMAGVYKVLAWISLVVGVVFSLVALIASSLISQQFGTAAPAGGGFIVFLVGLLYTLFTFGTLLAIGEGIDLLFDIRNNTQRAVEQQIRPAA